VEFSDSVLEDSVFFVLTKDGNEVTFPVSSEGGGDRRWLDEMRRLMRQASSGAAFPRESD